MVEPSSLTVEEHPVADADVAGPNPPPTRARASAVAATGGASAGGRAYQRVLAEIERQILSGALRVGDRLPGERPLSALLGVSRPSLREALRVMEAMGLLTASTGSGPDAGAIIAGQSHDALATMLRLHVALANYPVADVVEVRRLLEAASAQNAAGRLDDATDAELTALIDTMADPELDMAAFLDLDTRLHTRIAEISGNLLLADLMAGLRGGVRHLLAEMADNVTDMDAVREELVAEHRAILAALRVGDAETARNLVDSHVAGFTYGAAGTPAPTGVMWTPVGRPRNGSTPAEGDGA